MFACFALFVSMCIITDRCVIFWCCCCCSFGAKTKNDEKKNKTKPSSKRSDIIWNTLKWRILGNCKSLKCLGKYLSQDDNVDHHAGICDPFKLLYLYTSNILSNVDTLTFLMHRTVGISSKLHHGFFIWLYMYWMDVKELRLNKQTNFC